MESITQIEVFNNSEFGDIRTIEKGGEPWFCMTDICKALDIGNTSQAKARLNDIGVITNEVVDSKGRKNKANFVNESNMYKLIFQSRKPSAEQFTEWVTSEVIPAIRKHGSYIDPKTITATQNIKLLNEAIGEIDGRIESVKSDLDTFKQEQPMYPIELDEVTKAARIKIIDVMGGKQSEAYKDKSLRSRVFRDIYEELHRQFGVVNYKAIHRKDIPTVKNIIDSYELPIALGAEVEDVNAQTRLAGV